MSIDDRSRQELFQRLDEALGPKAAEVLMAHLPPVGWADVATKHDLAGLEERMDLRFEKVESVFTERLEKLESVFTERVEKVEERVIGRSARRDRGAVAHHDLCHDEPDLHRRAADLHRRPLQLNARTPARRSSH